MGTGDGRSVLRAARSEPGRLHIGVDANRAALEAPSRRAARKPERGGVANALFVHASLEVLPGVLDGAADRVTVLFPWGSLLRAVAAPDAALLANLRGVCRPGARFEVVFSLNGDRDASEAARLGLDAAQPSRAALARGYGLAGFRLRSFEPLSREQLLEVPSAWAQRHAHGRPREVWRLRAEAC